MISKTGVIIIFGALVLTLGFVVYLTLSSPVSEMAGKNSKTSVPTAPVLSDQPKPSVTPPMDTPAPTSTSPTMATGNIDDAVNAVMSESSTEAANLKDGENDTNEITSDSQVITDFSRVYNENQL